MQAQTFETSKGTILAVRLPEGATNVKVGETISWFYPDNGPMGYAFRDLPPGDWKEIGLWGSVSEEKAKEVVNSPSLGLYIDYTSSIRHWFSTALESLQSLLQTKIPLTHDFPEPKPEDYFNTETPIDQFSEADKKGFDEFSSDLMRWESGEGKVWRHFYLIFKTK